MKKIITCGLVLASLFCFTLGSTAFAMGETRIFGSIESSKVELNVTLSNDKRSLKPGETAKEILEIKNMGDEAYIRITPVFSAFSDKLINSFTGVDKDWVLKNGMYYYPNKITSGSVIRFCDGIKIPEDFTNCDVKINFQVDAIQSANIIPDFNSLNPWGAVEVKSVESRAQGYELNLLKGVTADRDSLELHYNDDAQTLIKNFDEIFKDMPLMRPGDSYTEVISLYNPTDTTKVLNMSDVTDDAEILKYITVGIQSVIDGKQTDIYSGTLSDTVNEKGFTVGTMEPGSKGELRITTKMDKNAGNEASALSGHLALSMVAGDEGSIERFDAYSETESGVNNDTIPSPTKIRSAKTGDEFEMTKYLMAVAVLCALGALFIRGLSKSEGHD